MSIESQKFYNKEEANIETPAGKEPRRNFVESVRKKFKQALHAGLFTAMTWTSMSESLGPDAKELLADLKFQDKISSYKEKADRITAMKEVLMREKILDMRYIDMLEAVSGQIDILQQELGEKVDDMIDAYEEEQFEKKEERFTFEYTAETEKDFGPAFRMLPDIIDFFPEKWSANIKEIEFKREKGVVPSNYGLAGKSQVMGQAEGRQARKGILLSYASLLKRAVPSYMMEGARKLDKLAQEQKITFFELDKPWSIADVEYMLPHELAHQNDWTSAYYLSLPERINLAVSVLARVRSNDRYHSSYVESINNSDVQLELQNKMVEYWAEIVMQYYVNKGQLPEADRQLVEYYLALAEEKS